MHLFEYKNFSVEAISIGGIETCYVLPGYDLAFDSGRCPERLIDMPRIFLTHGHLDHSSGIPYYFSQRSLRNMAEAKVYCPEKLAEPLSEILRIWHKIEDFEYPVNVLPMAWHEKVLIRKDTWVQALPSYHRIPSQGYVIVQQVTKLKNEYLGLPGREIQRMKAEKKEIFEVKDQPQFCFSGDSTMEFVLNNPLAAEAKVLFLECTYIDDKRPVERARKWGHIHLDEIAAHADVFQNERLVLVHFSRRYRPKQILQMLDAKLPPHLRERTEIIINDW